MAFLHDLVSDSAPDADPNQPAGKNYSDAEFIAVETNEEFANKKNLRQDGTETNINERYVQGECLWSIHEILPNAGDPFSAELALPLLNVIAQNCEYAPFDDGFLALWAVCVFCPVSGYIAQIDKLNS